jgi:hypothetical protein
MEKLETLSLSEFYISVENIDRACSTVIENTMGIFLPHKRLDKSQVQEEFYSNNQTLVIRDDLYVRVELQGRLLCQTHKDILEALLTEEKIWIENLKTFKIEITAHQLFKKLATKTRNKEWLSTKLDEIKQANVKIIFKNETEDSFFFDFFLNVHGTKKGDKEKHYAIYFSPTYSHFMAKNELLDYSNYVKDLLDIENQFVKAVVRFMLAHNGRNSRISIENFVEKTNLRRVISDKQLNKDIKFFKEEETQNMLKDKFGIELENEERTIIFNTPEDKKRYYIQPSLDLDKNTKN